MRASAWSWTLLVLLALPGCRRESEATDDNPPPVALERLTGIQLHQALGLLDRELVGALRADLDGPGRDAFVRAEAISDRLLETRFPFQWLRSDGYSVQARIRQIQARTDRIDALLHTGAPHDSAIGDLRRLRRDVLALRRELAEGGGPTPVPLERLLAGRDTLDLLSGEPVAGD